MIFIQVLVYTVLAALGALAAEALEARFGQHLGMGVIALMAAWVASQFAGGLIPGEMGLALLLVHWLLTGVGIALVCGAASFLVYTVNSRQALIIGAILGIGHVLFSWFVYWAFSY